MLRPLLLLATTAACAVAAPRDDLRQAALAAAPPAHREAVAFLVDHMPERDVKGLEPRFLLENTALAFRARERFPWGKQVPREIFLNDVLPYASLDESRDDWRADFLARFGRHVAGCKTAGEAVAKVAQVITAETGVKYNTKRRAPNQGPRESMDTKMASCTGLSILLVDALRAICVPARVAGIAMWANKEGNHNWVEVWLPEAKRWQFTEYDRDPQGLDHGWLLADAARGVPGSAVHGIWATSWQPTGHAFPLVWNMADESVPGVDVTRRYIDLGARLLPVAGECELHVEAVVRNGQGKPERRPFAVEVRLGDVLVQRGTTPSPRDDLNRFFTTKVRQGLRYQVILLTNGKPAAVKQLAIGDKEVTKRVTFEPPAPS